jgi:nucleotide-binding universal stress UspA family protein
MLEIKMLPPTNISSNISSVYNNNFSLSDSRIQYGRILVPYDGSNISDRALRHAAYLSKVSNAEIVILYVVEDRESIATEYESSIGKGSSNQRAMTFAKNENIRQMLEERVRVCKGAGLKEVSYVVRAGKPADEIISLLAERYFDLIVMGSNRISSTMGVILGSNARRVLNKVQRSVLIIH